jgi:Na+-driven multidrug efflux pump
MVLCGVLQSEGRSGLFAAVQVSAFVLNFAVFDPLFLLVFKMELFGAGLAVVCARGIPLAAIGTAFLCGMFETRTTCGCFFKKFCASSWEATKTGFTEFSSYACFYLPNIIVQKYITLAAEGTGRYTDYVACYNVVSKVWQLAQALATALPEGFLPAASYAVAAHRPNRVLKLAFWSAILVFAWCSFTEAILLGLGKYIAECFVSKPDLVRTTQTFLRITYMLACLSGEIGVTTVLLQATKRNGWALLFAVSTQMIPVPLFATILYFTDPNKDVFRLVYMWAGGDALNFVTSMIFMTFPLREMWKIKDTDVSGHDLQVVHTSILAEQ